MVTLDDLWTTEQAVYDRWLSLADDSTESFLDEFLANGTIAKGSTRLGKHHDERAALLQAQTDVRHRRHAAIRAAFQTEAEAIAAPIPLLAADLADREQRRDALLAELEALDGVRYEPQNRQHSHLFQTACHLAALRQRSATTAGQAVTTTGQQTAATPDALIAALRQASPRRIGPPLDQAHTWAQDAWARIVRTVQQHGLDLADGACVTTLTLVWDADGVMPTRSTATLGIAEQDGLYTHTRFVPLED